MCRLVVRRSSFMRPLRVVCANVSSLPFASASADLLVANLSLQWTADLPAMFNGLRRVLRPGGLLLFSIPGTDSLKELKSACQDAGLGDCVNEFMDMHDMGDALMASGFREPVMDAETITLAYKEQASLMKEIEAVGAASYCRDFEGILSQAGKIASSYPVDRHSGHWPLSWEIVYGAAFGPEEGQPVRHGGTETATFSVDALRATRGR
jgi:malonyl-CoA O-methyltransferase